MITFTNLKTGEVKTASSFRVDGEKTYVKFTEDGKEYGYSSENIQIHKEHANSLPFKVYSFGKECYRCHHNTNILTYIIFSDNPSEDVHYPWDKKRLIKNQTMEQVLAHMKDPSIEFYALDVVGINANYDKLLMAKYPEHFKKTYSQTQKRSYIMNTCEHCGAGQGWNYVYRRVNELIKNMIEINFLD